MHTKRQSMAQAACLRGSRRWAGRARSRSRAARAFLPGGGTPGGRPTTATMAPPRVAPQPSHKYSHPPSYPLLLRPPLTPPQVVRHLGVCQQRQRRWRRVRCRVGQERADLVERDGHILKAVGHHATRFCTSWGGSWRDAGRVQGGGGKGRRNEAGFQQAGVCPGLLRRPLPSHSPLDLLLTCRCG